jgi:RNA polymerase sigma factor (sigma-70 family)
MGRYVNESIKRLATELKAGLLRLRKGYIDQAEALIYILDPTQAYPYEFVVYRLTGYRAPASHPPMEPLSGRTLRADLLQLILDVCDSFELRASDYSEPVHDALSLARRFSVSSKTLQRWRRRGMPARRMVFPDRKRRIAFLESTVNWFVRAHDRQVKRSMRFTRLKPEDRDFIVRRARRMAAFTHCSLSDVAKRLAARTGRASETIRYTIRKHDLEHPDDAVFPYLSAPLGDQEKTVIYRCFLNGVPVPGLAEKYRRTRGSVYRIINEMRARQFLQRPVNYVYNPQFDLPGADEILRSAGTSPAISSSESPSRSVQKSPADLPPYLRSLYDVPLLTAEQERALFRLYNYLKYKADKVRRQIDENHIRTAQLKQIESLLLQANMVKNQIIRANLRLVVSIAKKHLGGPQSLFELISDGNVSLIKAVEKFDYSRGYRFSTYASWAIMRNFARSVPKERYQLDRFTTGQEEILDIAGALQSYDSGQVNLSELRESIDVMLTQLSPRERAILIDHYGLDESGRPKTFDQLGRQLGISKERVRQIELQALRKLRLIMRPRSAEMLS